MKGCPDCEARKARRNEYNKAWAKKNRKRLTEKQRKKRKALREEEAEWKRAVKEGKE